MINKEEIIKAVAPFNLWDKEQETGIDRGAYIERVEKFSTVKGNAIAIIGVRRGGKTFIVKQFLKHSLKNVDKEQTLYVNFEEPKFEPYLNLTLLDEIYDAYRTYINKEKFAYLIFDEIQNIPRWEKWVRIMLEKQENVEIIVTGSNSKLLVSELSTILTGRTLKIIIFPLNFNEFLLFNNIQIKKKYNLMAKKILIKRLLIEYINYGGFPKIVLEKNEYLKIELIKDIFEGIIYRDVISRHKIANASLVRIMAELAISNFSSLLSANKLRNSLIPILQTKISPNIVVELLNYLEESFLIFHLPIFSYKVKEQKQYPKKIYCLDTGIINTVNPRFTKDIGRLYENVVAIKLKKLEMDRKCNIFYWKNPLHEEVDFVIKNGMKVNALIQVCYNVSEQNTKERELKALMKASEEFKCNNLLVITEDYETEEKFKGKKIKFIPLWKWLLENGI